MPLIPIKFHSRGQETSSVYLLKQKIIEETERYGIVFRDEASLDLG